MQEETPLPLGRVVSNSFTVKEWNNRWVFDNTFAHKIQSNGIYIAEPTTTTRKPQMTTTPSKLNNIPF